VHVGTDAVQELHADQPFADREPRSEATHAHPCGCGVDWEIHWVASGKDTRRTGPRAAIRNWPRTTLANTQGVAFSRTPRSVTVALDEVRRDARARPGSQSG
jgi:hypothetical protein